MQTFSVFIIPILFKLVKAFKKSFFTQIFHALCADFDDSISYLRFKRQLTNKKAKTLVSTFILFNDKLTQNPIDELTGLFVRELLGKLNGFVDCYQLWSVKLCNFKDPQTQDIFLY